MKTNGEDRFRKPGSEHSPIIAPGHGFAWLDAGPLSIMVSSRSDLRLLGDGIEIDPRHYRNLFNSRIFFKGHLSPRFSMVGPIIGAPYAVMVLETLIARGAKEVIYVGWCGAISSDVRIGDVIIPDGSFIDEGTSCHYQPAAGDRVGPSSAMVEKVKSAAKGLNVNIHSGPIWTTDAVYRETPDRVKAFQKRDVLAVEMELSALFTVGRYHRIEIAGILVVSDELSTLNWKPGFKTDAFKTGRATLVRIMCELCKK